MIHGAPSDELYYCAIVKQTQGRLMGFTSLAFAYIVCFFNTGQWPLSLALAVNKVIVKFCLLGSVKRFILIYTMMDSARPVSEQEAH